MPATQGVKHDLDPLQGHCFILLYYCTLCYQLWELTAWCPSCGGWGEFPKLDKRDLLAPSRAAMKCCHVKLFGQNEMVR